MSLRHPRWKRKRPTTRRTPSLNRTPRRMAARHRNPAAMNAAGSGGGVVAAEVKRARPEPILTLRANRLNPTRKVTRARRKLRPRAAPRKTITTVRAGADAADAAVAVAVDEAARTAMVPVITNTT